MSGKYNCAPRDRLKHPVLNNGLFALPGHPERLKLIAPGWIGLAWWMQ